MFEVIGIVVVCWIAFSILKAFLKAASMVRSQEYGKEAEYIATTELSVPDKYYNYLITSNIDGVKNAAILLRDTNKDFKHVGWPRLLAVIVYGEFHKDCTQWQLGNPTSQQLFYILGIMPNIIVRELERDGKQVMLWCVRAGEDYGMASDDSIKDLILRCAESRNTRFHYTSLPYERISYFADKYGSLTEWFSNYRGLQFEYNTENDESFVVHVETIDSSKEDKSGVIVCVQNHFSFSF